MQRGIALGERARPGATGRARGIHKATELDAENPSAWIARGFALGLERTEEALKAFTKATELEPERAEIWTTRALLLRKLGRNEEALRGGRQGKVEFDPEDAAARIQRGLALASLERNDEERLRRLRRRPSLTRLTPEHGRGAPGHSRTSTGTRRRLRRPRRRSSSTPTTRTRWMRRGFALSTLEWARRSTAAGVHEGDRA